MGYGLGPGCFTRSPLGAAAWGSPGRARYAHTVIETGNHLQHRVSRRDALIGGAVALAGLGAVVRPGSAWAARHPSAGVVYRLDATDRCTCVACHRHAENKLFATRAAAHHGRAHPGCQCAILRSTAFSAAQWRALFGSPSNLRRTAVDRRKESTRRALKRTRRVPSAS